MKKFITTACAIFMSASTLAGPAINDTYTKLVDKEGEITLPKDYRQHWTFLGSYFVKTGSDGNAYDVHTVYTQPDAAEYYRKHNKFPDGTVLIKDVNGTKSEPLTTGQASYEDAAKVTFMMVKDTKTRFKSNQSWREGWGWALFKPNNPKSQTTTFKGEGFNNCYGCHLPVKDNDWVYTQGYKSVLK